MIEGTVRNAVTDVQVLVQQLAASSINFEVTWWTGAAPLGICSSRDQVLAAVESALQQTNIEITHPYRTFTFDEPQPVREQGSDIGKTALIWPRDRSVERLFKRTGAQPDIGQTLRVKRRPQ